MSAITNSATPRTQLRDLDEYRRLCESHTFELPGFYNFGYDVIDRWGDTSPDQLALWWVGDEREKRLTFRQLSARTNQVANALTKLGLQRGDQVLLNLPSLVPWWECMVGLAKADMIAIPATVMLTEKDLIYRVQAAEIDAIVTDGQGADKIDSVATKLPGLSVRILADGSERPGWLNYEELLADASPAWTPLQTPADGPALIYFTSGTTGYPKMVLHSHASYGLGHETSARYWLGLQPGDLQWNLADPGWAKTAYSGLFGPWLLGSSLFVKHLTGKFNPQPVLDTLENYPITSMCAPPTVYRMLVQEDLSQFKPQSLQRCMAAGEPLPASVLLDWRQATGLTIREGYGQSETVVLCCNIPELPVKPGSMGLPPPGIELAVLDADGQPLPPGKPGEIGVRVEPQRPCGLFKEYWHNPEATAKCYQRGWYLTGDCAYTDDEGYFWFVARADDIITSAAYRIGPFEVEDALIAHPAVAEVAVIGKPDPERTEIVKAFVVLAADYAPSESLKKELQDYTKQATAPYKYPREIEFLDELPKTPSGKIRRIDLRQRD